MSAPAGVRTAPVWDAAAFERDFPSDRLDGLRPRPAASAPLAARGALAAAWAGGTAVTVDLPDCAATLDDLVAAARALAPLVDGVVLRELPGIRPSPSHGAVVLGAIVPVVVELSCRDRNRVALEGEVAALADAGAAILVTESADGVADVDVAVLTALARRAGAVVATAGEDDRLAAAGAHVRFSPFAGRSGTLPRVAVVDIRDGIASWPAGAAGVHLTGTGAGTAELVVAATRAREVRP